MTRLWIISLNSLQNAGRRKAHKQPLEFSQMPDVCPEGKSGAWLEGGWADWAACELSAGTQPARRMVTCWEKAADRAQTLQGISLLDLGQVFKTLSSLYVSSQMKGTIVGSASQRRGQNTLHGACALTSHPWMPLVWPSPAVCTGATRDPRRDRGAGRFPHMPRFFPLHPPSCLKSFLQELLRFLKNCPLLNMQLSSPRGGS